MRPPQPLDLVALRRRARRSRAAPRRGRAGAALLAALLAAPLVGYPAARAAAQGDACSGPAPVCAARESVFLVSSFDPVGSAVRIGPTRLVTARHVVADEAVATIYLADGRAIEAEVVATDYPGDLVLLEGARLPPGPSLSPAEVSPDAALYTVGADVASRRIRVYQPGRLLLAPPPDRPLARLHHDAYSQPGHSGGALVDETGALVGIVASGGENRFEAIPAVAIARLTARSGPEMAAASAETGAAVRECTLLLEDHFAPGQPLGDAVAEAIETACRRSGNRQLLDLAGQTLGRDGRLADAVALFEQGLAEDPNAVNTRIGLAVTLHLAREFEAALPHLRWLLQHADTDLTVLRLAIQAGVWGGDEALARQALERLRVVNPQSVAAAERFLDDPPPRPPKAP
jgi:hypothetical protein